MDVKEKIIEILKKSKNPLKSVEIAQISGIDKKDIDKSIKDLVKENKVFSPKKCFYNITQ